MTKLTPIAEAIAGELHQHYTQDETLVILDYMELIMRSTMAANVNIGNKLGIEALRQLANLMELKIEENKKGK